jgi:hypothetical protein
MPPAALVPLLINLEPALAFFGLFVLVFLSPFFPFGVSNPILKFLVTTNVAFPVFAFG